MPKPPLKPPLDQLESEMIQTFLAGHRQWRPDLNYPESHSDMQGGIRALLKRYTIVAREIPLDWREIEARCGQFVHSANGVCKDCGDRFEQHTEYVRGDFARRTAEGTGRG